MTVPVPFPLIPPGDDLFSQRSWNTLRRLLNRPHRNEFTVAVPCLDSEFNVTSLPAFGRVTNCGWGPALDGFILRRVRLVKPAAQSRSTGGTAYAIIKALLAGPTGAEVVGTFDTRSAGLASASPRTISTNEAIDKPIAAGRVLQVEVTQVIYPKLSVRDCAVLFDVAAT